jgi:hypothetical protein
MLKMGKQAGRRKKRNPIMIAAWPQLVIVKHLAYILIRPRRFAEM